MLDANRAQHRSMHLRPRYGIRGVALPGVRLDQAHLLDIGRGAPTVVRNRGFGGVRLKVVVYFNRGLEER
jgi:hypothetical protein